MGLLTAMAIAPFVLLSLPCGVWLDRVRKLPVYVAGEASLALIVASVPAAWWLGWLGMPWMYMVGFVMGCVHVVAGSAAMYHAMTEMGFADESTFKGPVKLSPPPAGTSVLVLGAGVAGMVAAMELRDAGYKVQVLEYNNRPGGRNWTLYGGDTYTELGGFTQKVGFDPGQYINPGPWRLPYHHQGILHYVNKLGVALEPFTQVNFNAYVHSTNAYGGKPQRYRQV